MIDLSSSSIEKKCYITHVSLASDGSSYVVTYADGHKETRPFSVHNYNVELHHMKEQFLDKKDRYVDKINEETIRLVHNELSILAGTLAAILVTSANNISDLQRILTIVLVLSIATATFLRERKEIREMRIKLGAVKKTDDFIKIMESFKVPVVDPNNGNEEEWYLVNLSNISLRSNMDLIKKQAEAYTPELRIQEGERLSATFRENYEKKLRKVYELEK